MRAAVRKTLEKRQQALRDKNAGIATGEPLPILWIEQLSRSVVFAVKSCLGPKRQVIVDALADVLPTAIHHLGSVITSENTSFDDKSQASSSLFWLFNCCMKAEQSLARSTARAEVAKKQRARAEAKKSRAVLATAEIPLIIEKKRKRIAKTLAAAQREIAKQQAPKEII